MVVSTIGAGYWRPSYCGRKRAIYVQVDDVSEALVWTTYAAAWGAARVLLGKLETSVTKVEVVGFDEPSQLRHATWKVVAEV